MKLFGELFYFILIILQLWIWIISNHTNCRQGKTFFQKKKLILQLTFYPVFYPALTAFKTNWPWSLDRNLLSDFCVHRTNISWSHWKRLSLAFHHHSDHPQVNTPHWENKCDIDVSSKEYIKAFYMWSSNSDKQNPQPSDVLGPLTVLAKGIPPPTHM